MTDPYRHTTDIPPRVRVLVTTPGSKVVRDMTVQLGLAKLQELVGGSIEHVTLTADGICLYCNDEGRLDDLPQNEIASLVYWRGRGLTPNDTWDIRGPAVLCGGPDGAGWDTDIPQSFVDALAAVSGIEIVREA